MIYKKNTIIIFCVILGFFCSSCNETKEQTVSTNSTNTISSEIQTGVWVDNEIDFYYDKTEVLTFEELVNVEHHSLLLNLDIFHPVKIIHVNEEAERFEYGKDELGNYYKAYTIYSLSENKIVYVILKMYNFSSGPRIETFIQYPFESEEEEEYIRNFVLEKDLPENIFTRSE